MKENVLVIHLHLDLLIYNRYQVTLNGGLVIIITFWGHTLSSWFYAWEFYCPTDNATMGSSLLTNDSLLNTTIKAWAVVEVRLKTVCKIHISHVVIILGIQSTFETEGNPGIIFSSCFHLQFIKFSR